MYILLFVLLFLIVILLIIAQKYNDPYKKFKSRLNEINRKVRKNNFEYYRVPLKIRFWCNKNLNKVLKNTDIIFSRNLYFGHPDLEFNYSHTMGNKIILSNKMYKKLLNYYKNNDKTGFLKDIGSEIIHESIHIKQRYELQKFIPLYEKWGFLMNCKIENFDNILKYKRQNPDAEDDDIIWNHNGKYYFINVFFNNDDSTKRVAYPLKKKSGKIFYYDNDNPIQLSNFQDYNNYFGIKSNNYTPNEIYAEYYDNYYKELLDNKKLLVNVPGYKIFKDFYKN